MDIEKRKTKPKGHFIRSNYTIFLGGEGTIIRSHMVRLIILLVSVT